MLINGQRFAIDWKQMDDDGNFYVGDQTQNESYFDYGEPIYAVADGTVTTTVDVLDANAPGVLPAEDPVLGPQITVQTVDGNHIVQDIGGGLFAFYAHLQRGRLLVKPGDKVKKGQVIAKLGNTGNANASHMHFHLMNGPSVLGSDGVPYVIDQFILRGQIPLQAVADADLFLTGPFPQDVLSPPQDRTDQIPLSLTVVDFPGQLPGTAFRGLRQGPRSRRRPRNAGARPSRDRNCRAHRAAAGPPITGLLRTVLGDSAESG